MDIEITSVSKRPQRLASAAAAVFVITQEDIRRSGLNNIPELLRMVPGLDVAQVDSRHWAISSRGFNDVYSSKLLVLIDGRSVYTPAFEGVFWDLQDLPLEDIDRIEVIRGPGGTIWGANAVNGVINIITKSAKDTQGLLVSAGGGTEANGAGMVRYGGKFANDGYFRLYAKGFQRNASVTPAGADAGDSWRQGRVGFRADWDLSADDALSAQGGYYRQSAEGLLLLPNLVAPSAATPTTEHDSGGDFLASWSHRFSSRSDLQLQAYFDRVVTQQYTARVSYNTLDIEARHHVRLGERHEIVWGAGYRRLTYDAVGNDILSGNPPQGLVQTFNVFGQDEIALSHALHLIAGVKLEHNTYTGWENEPSLRLVWTPTEGHTLWAAVSRAIRVPGFGEEVARFNYDAIPGAPPILISVFGNRGGQVSEREISWEAGYRGEFTPRLSVDAAVFYSRYTDLASFVFATPFFELDPPPPHLVIAASYANRLRGETYGGEISVNWQATRRWRLSGSYTALVAPQLRSDNPALDLPRQINTANSAPRNQFQLHSRLDLPARTELDAALYRVGAVKLDNTPAYTRLDIRFGWRPVEHLELSLAGQNLLDSRHPEFAPGSLAFRAQSEVPRGVYLKATVGF